VGKEALVQAKKDIEEIYKAHDMRVVSEVMEIISKYESADGKALMEYALDDLQADSLKLCSFNFTLGTFASNLEADSQKATNMRRFKEAEMFCNEKQNDPKATIAHLEKLAEVRMVSYRMNEVEAQRKAMIMREAVKATSEMVNMLKKVVERLMWQGNQSNL